MPINQVHLFDLPPELLDELLMRVAQTDYHTLDNLARTCHFLKERVEEFQQRNPFKNFCNHRVAGLSSDEENDYDEDYLDTRDTDDIDDFYDRYSCGSNYDDEMDEFLNGPEQCSE